MRPLCSWPGFRQGDEVGNRAHLERAVDHERERACWAEDYSSLPTAPQVNLCGVAPVPGRLSSRSGQGQR
jgi:hypothetical protein